MAVPRMSSLEVKLALLRIHNPPRRQNVNAKTAPIRANVFIIVFCYFVFDVRTPPTRDVNPVKVCGPTGLYARDSGTDRANGGWLQREPV